jgi:hypothetical protein
MALGKLEALSKARSDHERIFSEFRGVNCHHGDDRSLAYCRVRSGAARKMI